MFQKCFSLIIYDKIIRSENFLYLINSAIINIGSFLRGNTIKIQIVFTRQLIDLKRILCAFLIICVVWPIAPAQSQFGDININLPDFDGTQAVQDLINNNISVDNIVGQIQGELDLPMDQLEELQDVVNNISDLASAVEDFDIGALGDTLEGIVGGNIDLSQLQNLEDTIGNIIEGNLNLEMAEELLGNIAEGIIPPQLGEIISTFEDLQAITDIESLQNFIENPEILEGIENLLGDAVDLSQVTEALAGITDVVAQIEAIPETIAAAIVDALPTDLVEALGGSEALTGALAGLIGGGSPSVGGGTGDSCGASCEACEKCAPEINKNHQRIRSHFTTEFQQHRIWLISNFFLDNVADAMALMTSQLVTVGTQQVQAIGKFFDAKHQLEMQRLFQTIVAKTHHQTHPSTELCRIGTNVQALAGSERISDLSKTILAERMMDRQLRNGDGLSGDGEVQDRKSRLNLFIDKYCNKTDHAGALTKLCENSSPIPEQINMDIDYTNAIGDKLTLEFDALKPGSTAPSQDEENVFALSSYLFGHKILPGISDSLLVANGQPTSNVQYLLDIRSLAAKRSVVQNSFAAVTSLKAQGDGAAAPFLKAFLKETGIEDEDIENRLGEKPSYYAQMETLTKTIFQNPSFYANLYDKPANVERKSVSLLALELMQDRDIYESLLRSEAVIATMIEVLLRDEQTRVTEELLNATSSGPRSIQTTGGGS